MKAKMGIFALALAVAVGLGAGLVFWLNNQNQTQAETKPAVVNTSSSSSQSSSQVQSKAQSSSKKRPSRPRNTAATRRIDAVLRANRFVGTALVVRQGKTVYEKGFGYANYGTHQKKRPEHGVPIGVRSEIVYGGTHYEASGGKEAGVE